MRAGLKDNTANRLNEIGNKNNTTTEYGTAK